MFQKEDDVEDILTIEAAAQLIAFAAGAEQRFAAELGDEERADAGSPARWGAAAVLAHLTDWKAVQVERMRAHLERRPAPACDGAAFPHRDPAAYAPLAAITWTGLPEAAASVSAELEALARRFDDADLQRRFPWTLGKPLAQQLVGRGLWHTTTHLSEYRRERGRLDEARQDALELAALIAQLGAWPVPGDSMGHYNVACLCALSGDTARARELLRTAVALDPGLRETARRDEDLAAVA